MNPNKRTCFVMAASVSLVSTVIFVLGLHRRPRTIRHFEEAAYGREVPFIEPVSVTEGLAVYAVGSGEPVLLFPYPHAATTRPMAQTKLADQLVDLGRTVVSFDVPGAYRSTREPLGSMEEMIGSAEETLDRLGIEGPVDVVGHSMGGLSALAFAVERPARVKRLVLVGGMSGFPAVLKHGMPSSVWRPWEADFWRLVIWGLRVKNGRGSLADQKRLQNLMGRASYHDPSLYEPVAIEPGDARKGVPIREVLWGKGMSGRLSYADRLPSVTAPTLIVGGRHDAEAPPPCSQELLEGIPDARLVMFERSGHHPFVEEPDLFNETIASFFDARS